MSTGNTTSSPDASIFELQPPVAVPCPPWCTEPPGHVYEQTRINNSHDMLRIHVHRFDDADDAVEVTAQGIWSHGAETVETPPVAGILLRGDYAINDLTEEQARELAGRRLEAADLMHKLA